MSSLIKYSLLFGIVPSLFLFSISKETGASKMKNKTPVAACTQEDDQKLAAAICQYLSANDSLNKKYLEPLKNYSTEKVESFIASEQFTAYRLRQNKDSVFTGVVHETITVAGKDTIKDKEYAYTGIVPANYNADKQYSLIIHLHGMGRTGDKYIDTWQKVFEETKADNYILICPTYPESNWSSKTGERIALTLMKKIKTIYNINDTRIFLTGMSRGGGGTYNISKFHTDLFAGIAPISGATDFENKALLLENFVPVPVYIIHGSKDNFVPVEYARNVYKKLQDLKCDVTYIEHDKVYEKMPSIGGHFYPTELLSDLVKWFDTKKRKGLPTKLFIYQTKNHHDRIYWLNAETLSKDTASIEGEIKNNRVEIKTDGVKQIKIFLNKELINFSQPVYFIVNNKEISKKTLKPDVGILIKNYKKHIDKEMLFTAEVVLDL
ncbi:MAG: hypothetical protein HY840_04990 [Bacteroidetes bacterium]|nr:hypothetical protein [Bacteroidota bacterium]